MNEYKKSYQAQGFVGVGELEAGRAGNRGEEGKRVIRRKRNAPSQSFKIIPRWRGALPSEDGRSVCTL